MLKTLLKSALIVLVLAGIFLAALQLWENYRKKSAPPEEAVTTAPAVAVVNRVEIGAFGEGASIQISDVPSPAYRLTPTADGKGFTVEIPGAQLSLAQKSWLNPNPLIASVEVSASPVPGVTAVVVRVAFTKNAEFKDRFVGKTLLVDVTPKPEVAPTPTAAPTGTPVPPKKTVKKAPLKSRIAPVKKPVEKRPAKIVKPPRKKELAPIEDLMPPPPPAMEPEEIPPPMEAPETPPTPKAVVPKPLEPKAAAPAETPGGLDLDKLFSESQKEAVPTEEPPKYAAIPPPSSGVFEKSAITKEYPKILDLSVESQGSATVVTIAREPKVQYQIFKLVNPNRLAVDFLNAQNGLQAEYGAFPGTKVRRVTTQQWKGDRSLVRVVIYLNGPPQYEKSLQGNNLVLKIK